MSLSARCLLVCSLLLSTSLFSQAHASLVEALDLATLMGEAEQVVVARVISLNSRFDERGQIVTDVAMQVEESVKGEQPAGAAIVVRKQGGVLGDIGMRVSGEPNFSVGETVVLFGGRTKDGALRPVGMSQGALRVFEQDGKRFARSANGGAATVKRVNGKLEKAAPAVPAARPLADLLSELRTIAEQQKKR